MKRKRSEEQDDGDEDLTKRQKTTTATTKLSSSSTNNKSTSSTSADNSNNGSNKNNNDDGSEQITADEAALYDRQIRLWGLDTQNRMRNAKVLLYTMNGLASEVAKNLALAGVRKIHILEPPSTYKPTDGSNDVVPIECLSAHLFLSPSNLSVDRGKGSVEGVKELNRRVEISHEIGSIHSLPSSFFLQFNIVCIFSSTFTHIQKVDEICKANGIPLFVGDTTGLYGFMFADLHKHKYIDDTIKKEKKEGEEEEEEKVEEIEMTSSFATLLSSTDWSLSKHKRVPKLLFAYFVLYLFEKENKLEDEYDEAQREKWCEKLLLFKQQLLASKSLPSTFVTDQLISTIGKNYHTELSPVCAVMGGIIAQEVIKIISGKGVPLHNFFVFDGYNGPGVVAKFW